MYWMGAKIKRSIIVVEMISELPDPQSAWGKAVKLYRPAISYISICKGLFSPIRAERKLIQAERKLIQAEYTRSELNIRDVAEQGGCRG